MRLAKYNRVLWDFNGTLLDDVAHCMDTMNRVLAGHDLPRIASADVYRDIFCFPVQVYYARLGLPGEGEGYVAAAHEWIEIYRDGEDRIGLRKGAEEALDFIRTYGVPQGVLSATEQAMLTEQVEALGIGDFFDALFGRGDIYATDKSDIAVRYAAAHPTERVLMIGDTVHDYETARMGNFDCILLEGGHQSRRVLETCGCPVVGSFHDLVAYLAACDT